MSMCQAIPHRAHALDLPGSRAFQIMFAVVGLLATRIYIFSELVTMLAFVAVLVVFGTSVVLLFLLLQECGRWIARRILEVAQGVVISRESQPSAERPLIIRLEKSVPTQTREPLTS